MLLSRALLGRACHCLGALSVRQASFFPKCPHRPCELVKARLGIQMPFSAEMVAFAVFWSVLVTKK